MGTLRNSEHIRVGRSPKAFEALSDPRVMAVVWTGAWSEASLRFAGKIVNAPQYNAPGSDTKRFVEMSQHAFANSNRSFNADNTKFMNLFSKIGVDLLGVNSFENRSRIEPVQMHLNTKDVDFWHRDGGRLTLLSVPAGVTTEILQQKLDGRFNRDCFTPFDFGEIETAATHLPQNAVMVFKGAKFPGTEKNALIHRRSNGRQKALPCGRMIQHFVI